MSQKWDARLIWVNSDCLTRKLFGITYSHSLSNTSELTELLLSLIRKHFGIIYFDGLSIPSELVELELHQSHLL